MEAHYLALGLVICICTTGPERIILGGGVMQQAQLFPLIRAQVQAILNGYLDVPTIQTRIDTYIIPPARGTDSGVLGAIALAQRTKER